MSPGESEIVGGVGLKEFSFESSDSEDDEDDEEMGVMLQMDMKEDARKGKLSTELCVELC